MPTQNVNLTPDLDHFVKTEVANGHFNSASEVHRAALAAMALHHEERTLRLERLRQEVQMGLDDLDAGRVVELDGDQQLSAYMQAKLAAVVGDSEAGRL